MPEETRRGSGPAPRRRRRPAAVRRWATRHLQTLFYALGLLAGSKFSTAMTASVIGVALCLPAGLYLVLDNVRGATRVWDGRAQLSVYLHPEAGDAPAEAIARSLAGRPGLGEIRVISRAEALEEYRRVSGFGDVLAAFEDENPLPAVVVVAPAHGVDGAGALSALAGELGARPEVDSARLDLAWLRRLRAAIEVIRLGVTVAGGLLAVAAALIIGNTIRLGIESRREEIEITRLVGGTDAFVRRPFLYTGALYGLLGGILAWAVVGVGFLLLEPAVSELADLYGGGFSPRMLDLATGLSLPAGGAAIGLAGSWLAVRRHLGAGERP